MSERASQPASTSKQLQRATSADHRLQRNTHPLLTTSLLSVRCCCKASDALNEMCSELAIERVAMAAAASEELKPPKPIALHIEKRR